MKNVYAFRYVFWWIYCLYFANYFIYLILCCINCVVDELSQKYFAKKIFLRWMCCLFFAVSFLPSILYCVERMSPHILLAWAHFRFYPPSRQYLTMHFCYIQVWVQWAFINSSSVAIHEHLQMLDEYKFTWNTYNNFKVKI